LKNELKLNVDKSTVSDQLNAMGKIQKEDKWIPHELSELAIQNRLIIRISLLFRHKKKIVFISNCN